MLVPCFMSWNKRSQTFSICTKSLFLQNCVHKFLYIPVSEHFSLPDNPSTLTGGKSRSWVHLYQPVCTVWRCVGERFADVNIVNRVPHGEGGVMVWAGISYEQRTQLHFINGNLNAQRYCAYSQDVTHWVCLGCSECMYTTACSSSQQYQDTSHSVWRGVRQHSTGHNQQPDQLYAKEMCNAAWGKWW